ncbi:MAG: DNA-processing protein DprA [Pseudomonadota bacterium]|nr:DNA-processing protein DprA [Pseudomonadota bacterium]
MDRDELAAWLRLVETPGLGRESARRLLGEFGSPEAAIGASTQARRAIVDMSVASALATEPPGFAALLGATCAWLDAAGGESRDVIVLGDPRYPQALLQAADPPLVLYAKGRFDLLNATSIAIVGSRNPTAQGLDNARAFAAYLSRAGFVIVSGLALGIDGAAHEGALEGGGGTIAVVGTGLDRVYPARHRALAHRITADGLIVSEFSIGTPALTPNFPIRNRIIAGLSRGTLVVEAAVQSGSLITARLAADNGRDVFAIPGSIHSPQARGCHALIKQGAKLVDAAADILEEYAAAPVSRGLPGSTDPPADVGKEDPLLAALGFDPIGLDALVARTGMAASELAARLLDLELAGHVARLPGQIFQRLERA